MCGFAAADLLCGLERDVRVNYVISCLTLTVTGRAPQCCASRGTFHLSVSLFQGSIKRKWQSHGVIVLSHVFVLGMKSSEEK